MHDPMTVAFQIKLPFWRTHKLGKTEYQYFYDFITIWHVDPERDGSDDSCGWSRPRPNKIQREIINSLASDEARYPWFQSIAAKENLNPVECECLVRGAILLVAHCMENRGVLRRKVTVEQATEWAALLVHNSIDNLRSSLAWLLGYHGNNYHDDRPNTVEEDQWFREQSARSFFGCIMVYILREQRYWWEHPRWHAVHWKRNRTFLEDVVSDDPQDRWRYHGLPYPIVGWHIQIHPLQTFKRWAFTRCSKCGKGFKWGESPMAGSWNGPGPMWFRSENVYHSDCGYSTPRPDLPSEAA